MKDLAKYKTFLFDLDGTLTDSSEGITKSVQYSLKYFGIDEPDLKKLECFIGPPLPDSYVNFYGFDSAKAEEARKKFRERYNPIGWKENQVYDGVADMLNKLKAAGKILGIASSKPEDLAKKVLERFNLLKYFDVVSAASVDGTRAKKSQVVQFALDELGIETADKETCVLVGDRYHDIEGAHACKIPCIGVNWGFAGKGEFAAYHVDYVIDSPGELIERTL